MTYQAPVVLDGSIFGTAPKNNESADNAAPSGEVKLPLPPKKKPGPKRDSRPASSEKLQKNRQAQRTHRERKEQYMKDLEIEVMRLKELIATAVRERDAAFRARDDAIDEKELLSVEIQRMRDMIQNTMSSLDSAYPDFLNMADPVPGNSVSVNDAATSLTAPTGPPPVTKPAWDQVENRGFASDGPAADLPMANQAVPTLIASSEQSTAQPAPAGIDYDELGLDFVLTLEQPCMGHIQHLHVRAHNYQCSQDGEMCGQPMEVPDDGENQHISGHSLMATAPPYSLITQDPGKPYPSQFPVDLKREDLIRLLDLSSQLGVDQSELPPVKVWIKLMRDHRVGSLTVNDLAFLKQKLLSKVHCYRFGAIVDENDIEEALQYVLDFKATGAAAPLAPSGCIVPSDLQRGEVH